MTARVRKVVSSSVGRVVMIAVAFAMIWWASTSFRSWSNDNGGFLSAIGLFLVIPFSIWSARVVEHRRRRELATRALVVLEHELWVNLNLVGQIDRSYRNNFELFEKEHPEGLHIPHHVPRVAVIEKFIEAENLEGLSESRQIRIAEIYGQLSELKEEFVRWRDLVTFNQAVINDRRLYEIFSSTLIDVTSAVMRNMVWLWVEILGVAGPRSEIPQIRMTAEKIRAEVSQGRTMRTTFKASRLKSASPSIAANDLIICWENDWKESPAKVIELCELAALHPSWVKAD